MRAKNEIIKIMKDHDCYIIRNKKHIVWKHPNGFKITTPSTPSCKFVLKKIKKLLKTLVKL